MIGTTTLADNSSQPHIAAEAIAGALKMGALESAQSATVVCELTCSPALREFVRVHAV